jgi:hypothetical protein
MRLKKYIFFLNMQGLTLTCLSTCPSYKEVNENVFDAINHFTKYYALLFPYHYYRESDK